MIDPGPRCYVRYRDYAMASDVYCIRYHGTTASFLDSDGKWIEFEDGTEPEPLFTLTGHATRHVLASLAQAISEAGVRPPERSHLEGKLEAQTAHLEDLRRLIPELRPR